MAEPTNTIYMIQITNDPEIGAMIKELAAEDMRSIGNQTAWIIRQEYEKRKSSKASSHNPSIADKVTK